MKILRSTIMKPKNVSPTTLTINSTQSTSTSCLPLFYRNPNCRNIRVNRRFCYLLQIISLSIISVTLLIYQVTITTNSSTRANNDEKEFPILDEFNNENPIRLINDEEFNSLDTAIVSEPVIIHEVPIPKNSEIPLPSNRITNNKPESLDNVFLSVKSTKRFHESRLEPILKTWFNLAKEQTWIFTDDDDQELLEKTNGHVVNTKCPSTHYRQALCCKMATEFDTFIQTDKSWFCHFDDDNYVNVPALLDLLGKYNPRNYWYLGKPSLKSPIRIRDPDNHTEEVSFWFATGGAGFCLSRALALRMSPLASGGKFTKVCDRIQLPDDVTIGYIAGHLLGQNLTVIPQFHSHFETMKFIDMKNPSSEITFSYVRYAEYENILEIPDGFSQKEDPTRFLSLHCQLFPNFSFCPTIDSNSSTKYINTVVR